MAERLQRTQWIHAQAPVRRWGRSAKMLFVLMCLLVTPMFLLYTNAGQEAGAQVLAYFMKDQPFSLEAKSLSIMSPHDIVLHDVTIHSLPELNELDELHAEQIVVSFQPWRLLLGKRGAQIITTVAMKQPIVRLQSAAFSSQQKPIVAVAETKENNADEKSKIDPAFVWPWHGDPITVVVNDGTIQFDHDGLHHISLDATAEVSATGVTMHHVAVALRTDTVQGKLQGKARLFLDNTKEKFAAEVYGQHGELTIDDDVYAIDSYNLKADWTDEGVQIQSLVLQHYDAHVKIAGLVNTAGDLATTIQGENINIERDIPVLAHHGFSGPAHFHGQLNGSLSEPIFEGEAHVGPGTVWHRHNVTGQGRIQLDMDSLTFHQVGLEQYGGRYVLDGRWNFAQAEYPGDLDLRVTALSGRASEIVALFQWAWPVAGRIDGEVHFQGPIGELAGEGYIDAVEAVVFEQPLDRIAGSFAWNTDVFSLEDVTATLGSGELEVNGHIYNQLAETDIAFSAFDWPLGFTRLFIDNVGESIGGLLHVDEGIWQGSWQQPRIRGIVHAEALRAGPFLFRAVHGDITYVQEQLFIDSLAAERAGGGEYEAAGVVEFPVGKDPLTDIALQVRDERLGSLLKMANQDLPALILDGLIRGSVALSGSMYNPEAIIDVDLQQAFPLQHDVRMIMELRNGTLRVNDIDIMREA